MTTAVETTDRISRLRKKYHEDVPVISIERALYYSESWRETENSGLSRQVRVAMAMKNVFDKMNHYVDPDDHIAGYWTEDFLGVPIEIERGVYNTVLRNELNKKSMLNFHVKNFSETFGYLFRKRQVFDFIHNMRSTRSAGPSPMNIGLETMNIREINPFTIREEDKGVLLRNLIPYWEGKTIVDKLEKEVFRSGLMSGEMKDFALAIPANTSRQTMMVSTCSTIATYQGHVIIDYEKGLKMGLAGMKDEVAAKIKSVGENDGKKDFLKSIEIALEGVIVFAKRLSEKLFKEYEKESDPARRAILKQMAGDCAHCPINPAETFRQAVQGAWILKTAVELAHPLNLHCFGRMDQIFNPYYIADLEAGRITRAEAVKILEELLLKVMSQNIRPESNILSNFYHRYLGSTPITIGGLTPEGKDGTNETTFLFIEAAKTSKAVTNVSLRVHKNTPDELYTAVAESIKDGSANLSIFNDDVNVTAMEKRGFETPDARDYAVMGCVEMLSPGRTSGMSANALLLCRVLDMTLRNGDSQTLLGKIKNVGLKTGAPESHKTFDDLFNAYVEQIKKQVELIVKASDVRDELFADYLPSPYISAFIEGCLDSCTDATQGGAKYDLTGLSFINSIANTADSLYVIKKLVFEDKEFSIRQLLRAIDKNYEGYEEIYDAIKAVEGKWGNGHPEGDAMVKRLTDAMFEDTYKYKTFRNGPVVPYVISMITHTVDGRISIATPDGRKAALPFAASCNPYNVEKSGVTGAMKSIATINFKNVLGCAVNMKFHPSAIGKTEEARKKWIALLKTYFAMGGAQLQPTVASAEMLRAAQREPENYRDLIVKVGGYSTYFTELGREIQAEIIDRTEHVVSE